MSTSTIIPITIELIPNQVPLESIRFDEVLFHTIKNQYTHKCTKKYGYILMILRVHSIQKKILSIYNGNIVVDCKVEITNLIPNVGQIYLGSVKNIYPQGSIVIVENCIRVFIPRLQSIKIGEQIRFRCIQVRFKKGIWDCIGESITEN